CVRFVEHQRISLEAKRLLLDEPACSPEQHFAALNIAEFAPEMERNSCGWVILHDIILTAIQLKGLLGMHIVNVTDIRQNASKIIARVVETGEPAVILQRSKPVVYMVEASAYEEILKKLEQAEKLFRVAETKKALQEITGLREKMAQRGKQQDSVLLIRELREGRVR
ncbi:MAG: type II toxin-antitoxin system Phd/YefM family antitoxin, partial [Desulfofundulus sp.]